MNAEKIVLLDPKKVQAAGNTRYALLGFRVDRMAESIIERGGIQQPVEVAELEKPIDGFTHQLTAGFYRHAGLLKANESGAGLKMPAIVRQPADATDRTRRQVSENRDRENMSPMDEAVAAKQLLDYGVDRAEVRKILARPGGRKGVTLAPLSNSMLNILLGFNDFPKAIRDKIHDGRLGTAAAYELSRLPKDKWEPVLTKAEANRQAALDRDEREDEKLAKVEETEAQKTAREAEKQGKVDAATAAITEAQTELDAAKVDQAAKVTARNEAGQTPPNFFDLSKDEQAAIQERLTASKTDLRGADKRVGSALKAVEKAQKALDALTQPKAAKAEPEAKTPAATAPKSDRKGKAGRAKGAGVGPQDVKKAAVDEGVSTGPVPLTMQDTKRAFETMSRSRFPKVRAIGMILGKMLTGEVSSGTAETELSVITGERAKGKA